jgi:esterase/lipase superfamily enzyme
MVITRSVSHPVLVQGSGYHNNYNFGNINTLLQTCPPEILIFVHGWHVSSDVAKEQLDRVKMSLENNSYNTHLIGYSWGSDIEWNDAKVLAQNEGPKLAQFITHFIQECNGNTQIRLLGHSLGSRVILSGIHALNNMLSIANFKLLSVNLMWAAVDDDEVSMYSIDSISNPNPWWLLPQCTIDTSGVRLAYGADIQKK